MANAPASEPEMLELYHSPSSSSSQRVLLALSEKGITDWVGHKIDVLKQEHLSASYLALNPLGVIPTLIDRGSVLTDSAVIIEYLNEAFRSEEHTSELQSLMRISYTVFCL